MLPPPPRLEELPAGYQMRAALGVATVLPDFDFETYSEAGYRWDEAANKWRSLPGYGDQNRGLPAVGAAVYSEAPSCEVLSLAYDLKDGRGRRHWRPGQLPPVDLFAHIGRGGLLEAWNVGFESWVWGNVCAPRLNWPPLPREQLRCAMAKARAFGLPGALGNAGAVLGLDVQKDKDGKRLLDKFSKPRNPTKKDPRRRIRPETDPEGAAALYAYNAQDIAAEAAVSAAVPDLSPDEFQNWQMDQRINRRGVAIDRAAVRSCIAVLEQAHARYNAELQALTGGTVQAASELQKLVAWCAGAGVHLPAADEDALDAALGGPLPPHVRRALEIRQAIGSAAVKKLYAMEHQATRADRLHDLFLFHAARTGRTTGAGPQPTNLPNSGPEVRRCADATCGKHYGKALASCPHCGGPGWASSTVEWCPEAVEDALASLAVGSLEWGEYVWGVGQVVPVIAACLRGLFVAAPGHDLICSDYSAIEAVVLAALAGEEWRMEVFRGHGKIYEMSASQITGIPFEEFLRHKAETGQHHPARKKIGKVAELASGYQGWVGAWRAFGAEGTDDEIKRAILKWRADSPAIVEFWGGQFRGRPWDPDYRQEYFGLEGCVVQAVLSPGQWFDFRGIGYYYLASSDALFCRLLSGRLLTYHRPRLSPSTRDPGYAISYEGWNTNPKNGPVGWIRMDTWGGRLTENVVQATARDIQWYGMRNLEAAGYPIVLHVYDEDVAEVPHGFGSVEEFERIMSTMPPWAHDWPIRASGGWRGRRYRK